MTRPARLTRFALGALLCATAMSQSVAASAAAPKVPPIAFQQRTLANGLRVIAIRDTTTPNVMTSMWYEVGSKHDPDGRSGFAHLFEHILSQKTVNIPFLGIAKMVDDMGGTRNASTWFDRTNYYEIVPAENLEQLLWTHAERMARPVVDAQAFETQRSVVKEELRQRVLAPPYGRLFTFVVNENVFSTTPHRRPTIGSISDLDSATLADARAFHQAYYGPDTATLIVAGNFEPAKLNRWVDKYFAAIPRRPNPITLRISAKDKPVVPRLVVGSGPNVPLPAVGTAYQLPGAANADLPAIEVLEAILSSGEHSRLNTALVKTGLASQVQTQFIDTEEESYLAVVGFAAGGVKPEPVAARLEAVLHDLRTAGPTADEVTEARNELLSAALQQRETFSGRAFELGERLVRTGDPHSADKRLAAIARVTPADVKRVAGLYLAPSRQLRLRYVQGAGDPKQWANPTPLPKFVTVPPATGPENQVLPEAQRQRPPLPGAEVAIAEPKISDTRLANGMRLVTARTSEVPLASLTVLIRAGSAAEGAKAGLANLTAHIAEKGTSHRSADQIAIGFERLGASVSTAVASDGTFLTVTAPAATLGDAAVILADVIRNPAFPDTEFNRERKRAQDGLSVAMRDPGTLASMLVAPVLYGRAPYGSISAGTPASLSALTRDDLAAFQRNWWRPELTSLVISGGIDAAAAKIIAERSFGDWKVSGAPPASPAEPGGPARPGRTLIVDLPGSGQAAVYAFARAVPRSDPSYYDALLANAVLGGSSTGRLFNEVRTKRALSYGAYSALAGQRAGGSLIASAQTKNESAADVAKVFIDELAKIASEPLDQATVTARQTFLAGAFRRQIQTSAGFNTTVASGLLQGIEPSEALAVAEKAKSTDGGRATAAMARILKPQSISLVIVGDAAKFAEKVKALRPDAEVIPSDKLTLEAVGADRAAP